MHFRQYSTHLEQPVKTLYDASGPINFERRHSPGQIGKPEFKNFRLLERVGTEVQTQLEAVTARVTNVFRYIGKKLDWE